MEKGYCSACGAEVVVSSVFCHQCGHRLSDAAEPRAFDADSKHADEPPAAEVRDNRDQMRPQGRGVDDPEVDLWQGGYSFKAALPALIGVGLLGLIATIATAFLAPGFFLIPLGLLLLGELFVLMHYGYMRLKLAYRLTSQRFEHEIGVLRRVTDRIEVIDVDDVTVEQGLIDRMFGTGKIHLTGSDRTHPEIVLVGIDEVRAVAEQIDKARRKERVRRGLHIEAI